MYSSVDAKPLNFAQHLSSVKSYANRVNLIKAAVPYANFAGDDPIVNRPHWLTVTARRYGMNIDEFQLSKQLSSFGYMDVLKVSNRKALVAVTNHDRSFK